MAPAGQEPGESGAIGTCAFNAEGVNRSQAPGPPFQLPVPTRTRWRMALGEAYALPVNGHGHMLVLVSVDSDNHLNNATAFVIRDSCHTCLLKDGVVARRIGQVSGQDCDGA